MNIVRNYNLWRKLFNLKKDADEILREYIERNEPDIKSAYSDWSSTLRNINCSAMVAILSEHYCVLEDVPFDKRRKLISYFVGATTRIADDLLDSGEYNIEEVSLFDNIREVTPSKPNSEYGLFLTFHEGLERLLPDNFSRDFRNVIDKVNLAQDESKKLKQKKSLSQEEVIRIKDDTGGYPFSLLYSLMFPENGDITLNLNPKYKPESFELPSTKAEAIFNLGAMASRGDDLFDERNDRLDGVKSLATEGIITWRTIKKDFEYVEAGLKIFYSPLVVEEIMRDWRSQSGLLALFLNNHAVPFINKLGGKK